MPKRRNLISGIINILAMPKSREFVKASHTEYFEDLCYVPFSYRTPWRSGTDRLWCLIKKKIIQ